ncbi:MAG TPA: hypothetical protein VKU01_26275 [Bryobacteraceae bacterium]|nr:hypothetical protein [Bryobacteraceae bacterium]
MPAIGASVGVANGKQCYNVPADQAVVQNLLSQIPASMGGTCGKTNWTTPLWKLCAADLHKAILQFQRVNSGRLAAADGHVDPGGATIQLMNRLASTEEGGVPGSGESPAESDRAGGHGGLADSDRTPNVKVDLAPLFAAGLVETNWQLKSSSSVGISIAFVGGGSGHFYLSHGSEEYTLRYTTLGGSLGVAPVSVSLGTKSMDSSGSKLYTFSSRPDLDLKDLEGGLQMVTISLDLGFAKAKNFATGGYGSVIWFGCGGGSFLLARALYSALSDATPGSQAKINALMRQLSAHCGAVGVLAGRQMTSPDYSIAVMGGTAFREIGSWKL